MHLRTISRAGNYYESTALGRIDFPQLKDSEAADVCVIGGGIAGCSTALELAEKGYRVIVLEAERIGFGASGRSGGQVIPGYACEQSKVAELVGAEDARRMWDISVEAIRRLRERIDRHEIECHWRRGQLQAAIKPRQRDALRHWKDELETKYDYEGTSLLDREGVRTTLATDRFCGGLFDPNAGHLHTLNYVLGLARAAGEAGARVFEESKVVSIDGGQTVRVATAHGTVRAKFAVICGNALLGDLVPTLRDRIMPVETYVIATESLGEARARELIRNNCGVTDANFVLDYFRLSADHRLLFGGRISYSGHDAFETTQATRKRLLKVFPQLADVKIDFSWSGKLDITMNRAPDFGRLQSNLYYLQGFSGHGLALAGMAGTLAAEAIAGQAERFDLFGKIKQRNFPGGRALRMPALVLAMLWYRLRDLV